LGDRLRKARLSAGLDQRDIADYLGMSHAAVGFYELDRRVPKLAVLRVWALRCGVPLDWLRYGSVLESPSTKWYPGVAA
jgi:transcriptional regulator with XRE-family HTH domain